MKDPIKRRGVLAAALAFIASKQRAVAERPTPHLLNGSPCTMSIECFSVRCRGGICVEGNQTCRSGSRCKHNWQCCTSRCKKGGKWRPKGKRLKICTKL